MALPAATAFTGPSITEAQFKTAMTDLIEYLEDLESVPIGSLIYVKRTTAPAGTLKANGAAVSVSTYADLTAAIYCGDANNATANDCYRCTDPGDPGGTRSTNGGYIKLPDERGEYSRGWDDGRGVDVARTLWSHQAGQNKSHAHTGSAVSDGAHTHTVTGSVSTSSKAGTTAQSGLYPGGATTSSSGAHTHTLTINAEGGTENLVRNNAWLACIKY